MKRPTFPLNAMDWRSDAHVTAMGPVARSGYLDLLLACWLDGSIPAPDGTPRGWRALGDLARLTAAEIRRAWPLLEPHFEKDDHARLRNRRVEQHRVDADEIARRRTQAGQTGAESRWRTHGKRMAD